MKRTRSGALDERRITLDSIPRRSRVEVLEIAGGEAVQRQLSRQGIRTGATLDVRESAPMGGPVLVETRGSTVALGRGVARKVYVRLLGEE